MDECPTIASRAKAAADSFRLLADIGPAYGNPLKSESTDVDDQLARFNIWTCNIGVFASGHASLDYRLRDSPEAKTLMIQLLEGLHRFLKRGKLSEHDRRYSLESSVEETPSDTYQSSSQSSYVSSNQSVPESADEADVLTPSEERLHGIEQTIDRLYRLSVVIRRPSIANQNVKAANFPIKDEEGNEYGDAFYNYALQLVTHRCQSADQVLRERLARSITLRRKRFLYRQKHQEKLDFKNHEGAEETSARPISKVDGTPATPRRDSPKSPKEIEAAKRLAVKRPPPSYTSASLFSRTGFNADVALESGSNASTAMNAPTGWNFTRRQTSPST
ncbi:hypothetical protein SLS58_008973 [Diplodia intermedia]|uniref:Uncharacterized protein n=1 Tax=Diplodia intermedia TaxID=856260 RepID=A0ABR3TF25_9PEZI